MEISGISRSKKITGQASKSDYKFHPIPRRTLKESRVTKTYSQCPVIEQNYIINKETVNCDPYSGKKGESIDTDPEYPEC